MIPVLLLGLLRPRPGVADPGQHKFFLESRIRIRIMSEELEPVPHSVQIQNVKSCVAEPKMILSAPDPAPAPAPDSFVRALINYLF